MIKLWAEDATADFTEFRKEWEKEKRQVVADISASIEKMLGVNFFNVLLFRFLFT